jgi:Domain of unknown function (DUF5004)
MQSPQWRLTLFTLFCFLCTTVSYSQKREDLVGSWKIVKVELAPDAPPEMKQGLDILSQIMLNSTFQFKENNSFSMDSPDADLATKDGIWQYDSVKKSIRVKERPVNGKQGVLMDITVQVKNGKYLFFMDETSVILTVAKK